MRILLLIINLLYLTSTFAGVYKSVDEDGNIIFTDKPVPGAEEIQVDEVQTIKAPETKPFKYTPRPKPVPDGGYTGIVITNPSEGQVIRDNTGNVTISVSVAPRLQTNLGDRLILYMDGQAVREGSSGSFSLENIDRGTHEIYAAVERDGKKVTSSSPVSFTLQRATSKPSPPPKKPSP